MSTNPVASLLLRPGMAVDIRGQLVLRDGEIVVTGYRMLTPEPGGLPELTWELTPYVGLDLDDAQYETFYELLGRTISGRGRWNGRLVEECTLRADDSWTHDPRDIVTGLHKDLTAVSDHTRSVEAGLFSRGVVLRRVRLVDGAGPRVVVSATDVGEAARVLAEVYPPETLEIHRSRWSASELRALDDVLNDLPDEKVLKVEYRLDGEGVISRKLRVDHVDAVIARLLRPFPPEMLLVEALLEPAGTPPDRDPWFPPAPRIPLP